MRERFSLGGRGVSSVGAGQRQMRVVVGDGLGDVDEFWFGGSGLGAVRRRRVRRSGGVPWGRLWRVGDGPDRLAARSASLAASGGRCDGGDHTATFRHEGDGSRRTDRSPTLAEARADDSQPARPTRSTATREEMILRCAPTYAAASQGGDRAPMAAVRAIVPPTTKDPAAYAKRIIAEARRRGLLTSHGRGKAQGRTHTEGARTHGSGEAGLTVCR